MGQPILLAGQIFALTKLSRLFSCVGLSGSFNKFARVPLQRSAFPFTVEGVLWCSSCSGSRSCLGFWCGRQPAGNANLKPEISALGIYWGSLRAKGGRNPGGRKKAPGVDAESVWMACSKPGGKRGLKKSINCKA